jgi:DNA invertase Pin-like site-specific DNA recombinase
MSKPFAGYIRVSATRGRKGSDSFISPTQQREEIQAWATRKGFDVVFFEELDKSGGTMERPKFQTIMSMIDAGELAGIACAKLDRYSRTLVGALKEFERVDQAGGEIVLLDQDVDTTDPDSMFTFQLRLSMAERERKIRRKGFRDANERAVADGVHICTVAPVGYTKPGKRKPLVLDPVSSPHITKAFRMRAGGSTFGDIAAYLGEHGVENEKGALQWRSAILGRIFSNRAYLGEAFYSDLRKVDAHPALIDRATWEAAQAVPRIDTMRSDAPHVLRGLVWCAGCRRNLTPDTRKMRGGQPRKPVYTCRGHHADGICEERAAAHAELLEPVVEEAFWTMAQGRVIHSGEATSNELQAAQEKADAATAERVAFRDNESLQALGDDYTEGLRSRKDREDAAYVHLGEVKARHEHPDLGNLTTLRTIWPELIAPEKRKLIAAVIGAVVLRKGSEPVADRVLIFARGTEPTGELATRGSRIPVAVFPFD